MSRRWFVILALVAIAGLILYAAISSGYYEIGLAAGVMGIAEISRRRAARDSQTEAILNEATDEVESIREDAESIPDYSREKVSEMDGQSKARRIDEIT